MAGIFEIFGRDLKPLPGSKNGPSPDDEKFGVPRRFSTMASNTLVEETFADRSTLTRQAARKKGEEQPSPELNPEEQKNQRASECPNVDIY